MTRSRCTSHKGQTLIARTSAPSHPSPPSEGWDPPLSPVHDTTTQQWEGLSGVRGCRGGRYQSSHRTRHQRRKPRTRLSGGAAHKRSGRNPLQGECSTSWHGRGHTRRRNKHLLPPVPGSDHQPAPASELGGGLHLLRYDRPNRGYLWHKSRGRRCTGFRNGGGGNKIIGSSCPFI